MKQFHPHSQQKLSFFRYEWSSLLILIQTTLNSIPYQTTSLVSPESIVNLRSQVEDYRIPQSREASTTKKTVRALADVLQEVRLAILEHGDLLQKGVQNNAEPQENQTVWYYKNPDDKKCGIIIGSIKSKDGSDYIVKMPSGEEVKLSPSRLYMIHRQEDSILYLLRDDSLKKKKLEYDIESNPGPAKYCSYCGKGIHRGWQWQNT